ncbi:MAG: S-layer protein [archaeon]|nr:S-layer protein [archaeon]
MKGFNVKKLAAIAAGAALIGGAIMPIATGLTLQKSDLYSSSGSPTVDVVVGSNAAISDVVWAGNIAAKLAMNAGNSAPVTCTATGTCDNATPSIEGLTVDFTVGGTVTYEDAKTYKNVQQDSESTTLKEISIGRSTQNGWLSDSQLSHLYNKATTYKYNGSDSSITEKEYIGVTADALFDYSRSSVEDHVLYLSEEGDFNYTSDLGSGVPLYDGNLGSGVKFTDGSTDNIKIPFFGQEYLVSEINPTGSNVYVKLILNKGKVTYNVGDEITGDLVGKGAYAGQDMKIKFVQLTQTSGTGTYSGTFELFDGTGTLVDTQTISSGTYLNKTFEGTTGNEVLETDVLVDTIAGVVNADGTISGYVEILKGTSVIEMYDGKGFPYDSSNTSSIYDWKVKMKCGSVNTECSHSVTDSNKLESIAIVNSNKKWDNVNPIYARIGSLTTAGESGVNEAIFLDGTEHSGKGYATVAFDGFETDEALTALSIGETCGAPGGAGCVKYVDTSGSSHEIPFYMKLSASSGSGTTTSSFVFDTKTIYYKQAATAVDVNVSATAINLNGMPQVRNLVGGTIMSRNIAATPTYALFTTADNDMIDLNGVTFSIKDANAADSNNTTLTADGNVDFSTAAISSSTASDFIDGSAGTTNFNNSWYYDDGNLSRQQGPQFANPVQFTGANSQTFNYALFVTEAYNHVWLLLDRTTNFATQYSQDVNINGTDTDLNFTWPNGIGATVENQGQTDMNPYYMPDDLELGGDTTDNDFYVATFSVESDGNTTAAVNGMFDAFVYVDTSQDELIVLPNNNLSGYGADANYNPYRPATGTAGSNGEREQWVLRMDSPANYMQKAYDDFGSKYEITTTAPYVFKTWKPQNIVNPIIIIKGTGTTTTTEGGEPFVDVAKGDTVTTNSGSQITVDDIKYSSATCVAGTSGTGTPTCTASPSTAWTPGSVGTLVYTDAQATAGSHIIVGGWRVNSLAGNITLADGSTLQDTLQSPGDFVAEVLSDGSVIVAGYMGTDTGSAAQELIDAIDALS